jgi:hypothetical protein
MWSIGLGTPFSFGYAALKRRDIGLAAAAAGYTAGLALVVTLLVAAPLTAPLGVLLFILLWLTGSIHGLAARRRVYPPVTPRERMNQRAIDMAKHRRQLREDARRIVADDVALALELRIGRPDLARSFDDGGLVDVNHAPMNVLMLLSGITAEMADRVVTFRTEAGPFVSVEELAVHADIPPGVVPGIAEYTVFLP